MSNDEHLREIPGWTLRSVFCGGGIEVASPTFDVDGMIVHGADWPDVIERVRNIERIWALALGRAGSVKPRFPSAGVEVPVDPTGTVRFDLRKIPDAAMLEAVEHKAEHGHAGKRSGPVAADCPNCGLPALVQDGACQLCPACGHKIGGCGE